MAEVKKIPEVFTVMWAKNKKVHVETYHTVEAVRMEARYDKKAKCYKSEEVGFVGCVRCSLCRKVAVPNGQTWTDARGKTHDCYESVWGCMRDEREWYTQDWDNFQFPPCTRVNRADGRNVYFVSEEDWMRQWDLTLKAAVRHKVLEDVTSAEVECMERACTVDSAKSLEQPKPQSNPKRKPKRNQTKTKVKPSRNQNTTKDGKR